MNYLSFVFRLQRPVSPLVRVGLAFLALLVGTAISVVWAPFRAFLIIPVIISGWIGGLYPGVVVAVLTVFGYSYIVYGDVPLAGSLVLQAISLSVVAALTDLLYRSMMSAHSQAERLATVLGSIGDAVLITDRDGRVTYLNPRAEALTGWQEGTWRDARVDDVLTLSGRTRAHSEAIRLGRPVSLEGVTLRGRDGKAYIIEGEATPLNHTDGRLRGVVVAFRDVTDRQRAQDQLRQNERNFRLALEDSPVAVFLQDNNLRYQWIYNARRRDPASMLGRRDADLVSDPDTLETVEALKNKALESGTAHHTELTIKQPDGKYYHYLMYVRPVEDGLMTTMVNITERRMAEEAVRRSEERLRESEERLSVAIKNAPLTVLTLDPDLHVVWLANPHPDFAVEDLLGRRIDEVLAHLEIDSMLEMMRQVLETGRSRREQFTFTLPRSGKQLTWDITIDVLRDGDGTINGLTVAAMEITERIELLREIEAERDKLQAVVDNITEEIWVCDSEGRVTMVNRAVRENLGLLERDNLDLREILSVLQIDKADGEPRPPAEAPLMRALQGETVIRAQEVLVNPLTGERTYREASAVPLRGPNRRINGAVATVRDITAQKRLDEYRTVLLERERKAREAAEEADALKTQFLGMISHELRTPLTSIVGFADTLMAEDIEWDEASRNEFLGIIADEASKLESLITELLNITRMQSGTFKVDASPHAFPELIAGTRTNLEQLAAAHRLTIDLPPDLPPVQADPFRIGQVLTNLVANAAKFAPQGTTIAISAQAHDEHLQVLVSDEGPGIALEDRGHVFDAFRRSSLHRTAPGAGLGLAICRAIVAAHGGRIWIEDNSQTAGACIGFTLPVVQTGQLAHTRNQKEAT
ncbi:MAG: PAS domain-containing protein [Chloroflexi bacterium]|nr:PAS domain-containing protein [Chloroflexota bacterium]